MPKKSSLELDPPEESQAPKAEAKPLYQSPTRVEEKMDEILVFLRRMERRDRWRTAGGFFRGLLGLIPIAFLLLSGWYFYKHGDELMKQITSEAVKQSAEYSQGSLMQQLEQYMQPPKQ